MSLSLAGKKTDTRIGRDPRNTAWTNDTSGFGHQQLLRMGWAPGAGLGKKKAGLTAPIKVRLHSTNKGLGFAISAEDRSTGLDEFQRILGRLNSKEAAAKAERQIQTQKQLFGSYVKYVFGGLLKGSRDQDSAEEKLSESSRLSTEGARKTKHKQKSKLKLKKAGRVEKKMHENKSSQKSKSAESAATAAAVAEIKGRSAEPVRRGIHATRRKFIAAKQQAVKDEKSLKEILMIV